MWFQGWTVHGWLYLSVWFNRACWCRLCGIILTGLSPSLVSRGRDLGGLGCTIISRLPLIVWYWVLLRVHPMLNCGCLSRVDGANLWCGFFLIGRGMVLSPVTNSYLDSFPVWVIAQYSLELINWSEFRAYKRCRQLMIYQEFLQVKMFTHITL